MKRLSTLLSILLVISSTGCTHRLEIKNLTDYRATSIGSLSRRISIGVVTDEDDVTVKRLLHDIATELQKYGDVVMPYTNGGKKVDLVADIRVKPEYRGSGANFLVNFPGFLIWAPAWHGYNYHVNYQIEVSLTDGANSDKIDQFSLPVKLNIRHAEMDRTWTEVSWFEVGVIALIGGIYSTKYDDDVTPLVAEAAGKTLGEYVSSEIVARINASGRFAMAQTDTLSHRGS